MGGLYLFGWLVQQAQYEAESDGIITRQLLRQVQQLTGENCEMRREMNSLHVLTRSIHSTVSGIPHLSVL